MRPNSYFAALCLVIIAGAIFYRFVWWPRVVSRIPEPDGEQFVADVENWLYNESGQQ